MHIRHTPCRIGSVKTQKPIRWDSDKNLALKRERSVSFEEVLSAIEQGGLIAEMEHPNMQRYPKKPAYKLDDEEMEILTAFEAGEMKPVRNQKAALAQMQAMATQALFNGKCAT